MARPEDSRVKIPALVHFTRLGYEYMSLKKMVRGKDYDVDTNIFYALFLCRFVKINSAIHHAVICNGAGSLPHLLHNFRKVFDAAGPVQQAELRMHM